VAGTVGIIGNADGDLQGLVTAGGMRPVVLQAEQLASPARSAGPVPDALLVDVRRDRSVLSLIGAIKRR
jgi:hypothetical protein